MACLSKQWNLNQDPEHLTDIILQTPNELMVALKVKASIEVRWPQ